RARDEPRHGRAEARDRPRGRPAARHRGPRRGRRGAPRAARPRAGDPPARALRPGARRRARDPRRPQRAPGLGRRRARRAPAGGGGDGRVLRRRRGDRQRREALGRDPRGGARAPPGRRARARGRRRRRRRRRPGRGGAHGPAAAGGGARRDARGHEPGGRPDDDPRGAAVRVVIAEDLALLRDGMVRLLEDNGFAVVAAVADADALVHAVRRERPDVAIVDVRLPPSFRDEGLRAALELRRTSPGTAILVVSQYVEHTYATELLAGAGDRGGVGYLLKDRVMDVAEFVDAVRRVGAGGT